MTDIEICQRDVYITFDAKTRRHPDSLTERPRARDLQRTTAMTIEIFYLTTQIQNWLNARVARHLAEQAERLAR
jgi:hypothetical protein